MYNIALWTDILSEKIYSLYMRMYLNGLINKPIIYANKCSISTHMNIPIFYTKYIFNQQYDIIISDIVIDDLKINNMCRQLIRINNETAADDILKQIREETIC